MDRSPSGASPSSMTMSTFLGGSSPSPGGGSSGNLYQNYSTTNSAGGQYSVSMSIRHEIQRFESVHPSIYAIYDLIELIPDQLLSQQIREHVVCIEGRSLKFLCTHTLGIFDEKKSQGLVRRYSKKVNDLKILKVHSWVFFVKTKYSVIGAQNK